MHTVTVQEAEAKLADLIRGLTPGEEVVIVENHRPVARLLPMESSPPRQRKLGTLTGSVKYMAPDFDAPLDEFREYME